jgi:hypothetical protein
MNLYAYCLSDQAAAWMIEGAKGVNGGTEPRLISVEGIKAVVSEHLEQKAQLTRENVFAHERVIGRVLAHTTPLPFRFGVVSSASELEDFISSQKDKVMAGLERVRGSVEMSVKIIWDVETARSVVEKPLEAPAEAGENASPLGRGAMFLEAKRREILGTEVARQRAEEVAAWLELRLEDLSKETEVAVNSTKELVIKAAHLVERVRLEEYRARLRAIQKERHDLHFLTSGPWSPYSFSKIKLDCKG